MLKDSRGRGARSHWDGWLVVGKSSLVNVFVSTDQTLFLCNNGKIGVGFRSEWAAEQAEILRHCRNCMHV